MKMYTKNKNFISEKIRYKMELNQSKREKGVFTFFLIINLIMIPITIESIQANRIKALPKEKEIKKIPEYYDDINIWINNIFDDSIEEAHIANNNGDIIVGNFDGVSKLSLYTSIRINEINLSNNEKYKLEVSLNE